MKHVLITGAGGFVGSHLAEGFSRLGYAVIAVDIDFDDITRARLLDSDSRIIVTDAASDASDVRDVRDVRDSSANLATLTREVQLDLVIHAAALTSEPEVLGLTTATHITHNLQSLLTILSQCERWKPHAFVFLSSAGVFAYDDADEQLTDGCQASGSSAYAVAKRAAEILVPATLVEVCDAWVLRLGNLYGTHERARLSRQRVSLVRRWLNTARQGEPLIVDATDPLRDWTCITDLAAAIDALIAGPAYSHAVHLASPYQLRDSELAAIVAAHFPGTRVQSATKTTTQAVRPPLQPSKLDALAGYRWTEPAVSIGDLCAMEHAA